MDKSAQDIGLRDGIIGFLVLMASATIAIGGLIWLMQLVTPWLAAIVAAFSTIDAAITVALITGAVSIVTMVVGSIINSCLRYRQKKAEFLRQRREAPYMRLISLFYDIQTNSKLGEELGEDELVRTMNEFNKELTLWGSSKAIKQWGEWRTASANSALNPKQVLLEMERVMIQLRRDMGQKRGLKQGDILKLTINDVDQELLIK